MATEHVPQPTTSRERLAAMLPVINTARLPAEAFAHPQLPELEADWREAITRLWFAVSPSALDPDYVQRQCRRAKRAGVMDFVKFDCPDLYGAHPDGTPTEQATHQLIARLHAALSDLLLTRPGAGRIPIPDHADAFIEQHFRALAQHSFTVQLAWRELRLKPRRRAFLPELRLAAPGVDTQAWNTLLEFLQDSPNYAEVLGKCPVCLRLFVKPRKNAEYCSRPCGAKARYERWKERGGLKKRKKRRILGEGA